MHEVKPLVSVKIDNVKAELCVTSVGEVYFRYEDGVLVKIDAVKAYGEPLAKFIMLVLRKED